MLTRWSPAKSPESGLSTDRAATPINLYATERFGMNPGCCPTQRHTRRSLSVPIFPGVDDEDVDDAIEGLSKVMSVYAIGTRSTAFAAAR
jgi:dTDP-4-amino-4,6-dideoxygalactose transaminase